MMPRNTKEKLLIVLMNMCANENFCMHIKEYLYLFMDEAEYHMMEMVNENCTEMDAVDKFCEDLPELIEVAYKEAITYC